MHLPPLPALTTEDPRCWDHARKKGHQNTRHTFGDTLTNRPDLQVAPRRSANSRRLPLHDSLAQSQSRHLAVPLHSAERPGIERRHEKSKVYHGWLGCLSFTIGILIYYIWRAGYVSWTDPIVLAHLDETTSFALDFCAATVTPFFEPPVAVLDRWETIRRTDCHYVRDGNLLHDALCENLDAGLHDPIQLLAQNDNPDPENVTEHVTIFFDELAQALQDISPLFTADNGIARGGHMRGVFEGLVLDTEWAKFHATQASPFVSQLAALRNAWRKEMNATVHKAVQWCQSPLTRTSSFLLRDLERHLSDTLLEYLAGDKEIKLSRYKRPAFEHFKGAPTKLDATSLITPHTGLALWLQNLRWMERKLDVAKEWLLCQGHLEQAKEAQEIEMKVWQVRKQLGSALAA